jgi:ligand-binding sensor domain-containing protein
MSIIGAPLYKVQQFKMAQGLPTNNITALSWLDNNTLAVGTQRGLLRYDGYRFVPIIQVKRMVNGIAVTSEGKIWINEIGVGVKMLTHSNAINSRPTPLITHYQDSNPDNDHYNFLQADKHNNIWYSG